MLRNLILAILLATAMSLSAQDNTAAKKHDRAEWFKEMRQYKHNFLAKEMQLTPEQKTKFFDLYDRMSEQIMGIHNDVRKLEHQIDKKKNTATDDEYSLLALRMTQLKSMTGNVELTYYDQFKQILSPKQMVSLKKAERKFDNMMMRQHAKSHKDKHSDKKSEKHNDKKK